MILPEYDGRCGWYELLGSTSNFDELESDATFDTVVIGGGFVGTAAARRLAENRPDDKVLLVDALKIGQGASGRNSGFVIDQPHKHDLERADEVFKRKSVQLNRAAIEYLEKQIAEFSIDCQWSKAGKYQGAVGARGEKYLNHYESLLRNFGERYERLSKAESQKVFGTDYYSAAIFTPGSTLVQPAALMRGLVDSLPANVRVVENSPVLEICRQKKGFTLKTRKAVITCDQLIVATSVFTPELGFMKDRILPVMTFASMTHPLTDAEMQLYGGKLDWGLTPADHAGTTMRMTQDRRLIIRNSYRYAPEYNTPAAIIPSIQARHREGLDQRYPTLKHVGIDYTWGGATSLSGNFETYFGQLEENIYSSGCDQSVGAARGTISGMMLADLASGKQSELLTKMQEVSGKPSRLPPKPLLRIGVPLRLAIARIASRKEV